VRVTMQEILPSTVLCEVREQIEEAFWRGTVPIFVGARELFGVLDGFAEGRFDTHALRNSLVDVGG